MTGSLRPSRRIAASLASLVAGVGLMAACTPPPAGGTDTAGPALRAPVVAEFAVGAQIDTGGDMGDYDVGYTTGIPARINWSASDPSGVCGFDVEQVNAASEPSVLIANTLDTTFSATETDYDDQFGGGSEKVEGWNVIARDCKGNTTTRRVWGKPIAIQENGVTFGYGTAAVSYTGTWGTSSCTCWSGGTVARTTEPGAKVSYVATRTGRVALVMEQAPNRGELLVKVGGVQQGVVDNGQVAAPQHRIVVWEGPIEAGQLLEVVNLATPGRSRIDLDAILIR